MKNNIIKTVTALSSVLLVVVILILSVSSSVKVGATEYNYSYVQEFKNADSLQSLEISDANAVSVKDGELIIENENTTELKLKNVQISNFALSTAFKVKSGDGSFSFLYNLDDSGKGHELRVNTRQIDVANSYSYYGTYVSGVEQGDGGKATEYRAIRKNADGEFDSKLYMFNFYEPFEYDTAEVTKEYSICLVTKDSVTDFYCNGVLVLKVPLFETFNGKNISIRVVGDVVLSFSDIKISGLGTYAKQLCNGLNFEQDYTKEELIQFKTRLSSVESVLDRFLSESEKANLEEYGNVERAKEFVKAKFAPIITIDGEIESVADKGATITLPTAAAKSFYDERCAVKVYVIFNGKYVKTYGDRVTLNESGTYTVRYIAHDASGNTAQKSFEIKV